MKQRRRVGEIAGNALIPRIHRERAVHRWLLVKERRKEEEIALIHAMHTSELIVEEDWNYDWGGSLKKE